MNKYTTENVLVKIKLTDNCGNVKYKEVKGFVTTQSPDYCKNLDKILKKDSKNENPSA